jgi:Zn finger protein HypA/HybF involved in hydrogenase expression
LDYYSPEYGQGVVVLRGPDRRELARWLYGLAAGFRGYDERHPLHGRKIDRIFESFVEFDAAPRDWWRSADLDSGLPAVRTCAREQRRIATRRRHEAQKRLQAFLDHGLARHEGRRLESEDRVWAHLAARGMEHPALRVCEQCTLVFRAPRARRCPDCRRRPVRIQLHPLERGGWHGAYRVGPRFVGEEFDRTVNYTAICRVCDARFETTHPHRRLCRNCGGPSGRVRRHRGSESRTGRQRFRYVAAEGGPLTAVSMNGPGGHSTHLTATDGVVETDDAEVAVMLDGNPSLRQLSDRESIPVMGR